MIVYSGPIGNNYRNIKSHYSNWFYFESFDRPGCVFSGDADFNLINIRILFHRYWNKVGTIQIPHHGDIKCFNTNFFDDRTYLCPMSVGNKNSYGHPSTSVCSLILANNSIPIKVTESLSSGFIQIITN